MRFQILMLLFIWVCFVSLLLPRFTTSKRREKPRPPSKEELRRIQRTTYYADQRARLDDWEERFQWELAKDRKELGNEKQLHDAWLNDLRSRYADDLSQRLRTEGTYESSRNETTLRIETGRGRVH